MTPIDQIRNGSVAEIMRVCRAGSRVQHIDDSHAVAHVLGGLRCHVDPRDASVATHLLSDGYWEAWVTRAVARHVQPGWSCVVGGANFGYYALLSAELVGTEGQVLAVECEPSTSKLLALTVGENLHRQTRLDSRALWSTTGETLTIRTPVTLQGCATVLADHAEHDGEVLAADVETVSLDDLLVHWRIEHVDFVLLDVEGAEPEVWNGMRGAWQTNTAMVLCAEYLPPPASSGRQFLELVRADGCRVRVVGTDGEVRELRERDLSEHQMLWVHR